MKFKKNMVLGLLVPFFFWNVFFSFSSFCTELPCIQ